MTRAVVLSDTHVRSGSSRRLPDNAYAALEQADVILHAGDVVEAHLLDELAGFAPVHAVLGNNDHSLLGVLAESRVERIGGVEVAMIHDSGPSAGREQRLARRFPFAAVVIFGHSHVPWNGPGLGGQLLFNPGSPTERRGQPHHTLGVLELDDGWVRAAAIVPLD